ncbi:hypothetical protein ACKZDW_21140 [Ralstonia syzygii subsp. celebesensis]|uniref:hypothetical protein n=1 Tax=Ralstonia syzygii TaxID=28097 RepID=UPI00387E0337
MLGVIADLTATKTIEYDRGSWSILYGSAGDDVLHAASDRSNNILVGGAGNDLLVGNDLANILIAGSGDDTLKGGVGFDQYVLTSDGGRTQSTTMTVEVAYRSTAMCTGRHCSRKWGAIYMD